VDHGGLWFTMDSWLGLDGALTGVDLVRCSGVQKFAVGTRREREEV
jgi:hypothetical protein